MERKEIEGARSFVPVPPTTTCAAWRWRSISPPAQNPATNQWAPVNPRCSLRVSVMVELVRPSPQTDKRSGSDTCLAWRVAALVAREGKPTEPPMTLSLPKRSTSFSPCTGERRRK
jgi:hypothetical protein